MGRDDTPGGMTPETLAAIVAQTVAQTMAATMPQIIAALKPDPVEQERLMREQARINAEERLKIDERDNRNYPGVSIYNSGGKADPKPELKAKAVTWGGTDVLYDLTTREEVELLNQLEQGYYECEKSDGSKFRVSVAIKKNEINGSLERMDVVFPTSGKHKDNLPSLRTMCRDMIAQQQGLAASTVG